MFAIRTCFLALLSSFCSSILRSQADNNFNALTFCFSLVFWPFCPLSLLRFITAVCVLFPLINLSLIENYFSSNARFLSVLSSPLGWESRGLAEREKSRRAKMSPCLVFASLWCVFALLNAIIACWEKSGS